jgi:hypothetical protein
VRLEQGFVLNGWRFTLLSTSPIIYKVEWEKGRIAMDGSDISKSIKFVWPWRLLNMRLYHTSDSELKYILSLVSNLGEVRICNREGRREQNFISIFGEGFEEESSTELKLTLNSADGYVHPEFRIQKLGEAE